MDIRPATVDDLPALYDVCVRTGEAGEDATGLYAEPDLLGAVYVGPYVALGGTVALAGVDREGVAAYVLGAVDTTEFELECERSWWPALRDRFPQVATTGRRDDELVGHLHDPPIMPAALVERYPAHLHIDLLPRVQGGGNGRRLLEAMIGELHGAGATGVHLGVAAQNTRAIGFYEHLGFRTLHSDDRGCVMGRRW